MEKFNPELISQQFAHVNAKLDKLEEEMKWIKEHLYLTEQKYLEISIKQKMKAQIFQWLSRYAIPFTSILLILGGLLYEIKHVLK